jgi:siroheme synthase
VVLSSVAAIADEALRAALVSPAIVVIGEVVALADAIPALHAGQRMAA